MKLLAQLPVQGFTVALREALEGDVPALVHLLAADEHGATLNLVDDPASAHTIRADMLV